MHKMPDIHQELHECWLPWSLCLDVTFEGILKPHEWSVNLGLFWIWESDFVSIGGGEHGDKINKAPRKKLMQAYLVLQISGKPLLQQKDYNSLHRDTAFFRWSGTEPAISLRYACTLNNDLSRSLWHVNGVGCVSLKQWLQVGWGGLTSPSRVSLVFPR